MNLDSYKCVDVAQQDWNRLNSFRGVLAWLLSSLSRRGSTTSVLDGTFIRTRVLTIDCMQS